MTIRDVLIDAKQSNKIVSIHTDPSDQSRCSAGFVDQINDIWVRLRAIGPEGEDEGYEIRLLNEIFRVDLGGRYEKKIALLGKNFQNTFHSVELAAIEEKEDVILRTLDEVQKNELVVILRTEDDSDSIIGYVQSLEKNAVRILALDDFGQEDGLIVIDLAQITSLDCNARRCQILRYLHKVGSDQAGKPAR